MEWNVKNCKFSWKLILILHNFFLIKYKFTIIPYCTIKLSRIFFLSVCQPGHFNFLSLSFFLFCFFSYFYAESIALLEWPPLRLYQTALCIQDNYSITITGNWKCMQQMYVARGPWLLGCFCICTIPLSSQFHTKFYFLLRYCIRISFSRYILSFNG